MSHNYPKKLVIPSNVTSLSTFVFGFTVTATDAAGNVSNPSTISHTINYTPPSGGGGSPGYAS